MNNAEARVPVVAFGDSLLDDLANICRPVALPPPVYAGYIAIKVRNALKSIDVPPGDHIVEPESVVVLAHGGGKYAVYCRDFQDTAYRITVEPDGDADAAKLFEARLALDAIQKAAEHWAAFHPGDTTALLIASLAKEILERAE